jgi:peptidoglycan/LPS O-acetylase OafA/YrhL
MVYAENFVALHPKYRSDIDGLRAVAVLAVVAYHAFPRQIPGGFIGVDVFFVISGFLISRIILENLESGTFSFSEFYSRRIRRIFPALIIMLLGVLAVGWLSLMSDELTRLGKHVAAGAAFSTNFILQSESGYFDSLSETKPLLHLWSLGIEEQFYLVWPLILWIVWKSKIRIITIILLLGVASFYFNVRGVVTDPVSTFYSPETRFWELMTGGVLAWSEIYVKRSDLKIRLLLDRWLKSFTLQSSRVPDGKTLSNLLATVGFMLVIFCLFAFDKWAPYPGLFAMAPVLGTVFIIYAGPSAWVNQTLLSNKVLVWFGLISFPLYLWHWPLISFAWIVGGGVPSKMVRVALVLLAILLAWLTKVFIENPFRVGQTRIKFKVSILCVALIIVGLTGFALNQSNISQSRQFQDLAIERRGAEFGIGSSLNWYEGKDNWLFLGNGYDQSVAKLQLAIKPSNEQLEKTEELFSKAANATKKHGADLVLILGPNKESIYPEHLPEVFQLTNNFRYSSYFLDGLKGIPNLTVYDPTNDLLTLKKSEGLLYWKTDTHWNRKGAFLVFKGLLEKFAIPTPKVDFKIGATHSGDLIEISGLSDFPLDTVDDWKAIWDSQPNWSQGTLQNEKGTPLGALELITNSQPLSKEYIWVIGDSFSTAMQDYFNATFKQVLYVGHWGDKLATLPADLANAKQKPDMVVVVRVERSF